MSCVSFVSEQQELFENKFVKKGYTFAGWSDGTNTYTSNGTSSFTITVENYEKSADFSGATSAVSYEAVANPF